MTCCFGRLAIITKLWLPGYQVTFYYQIWNVMRDFNAWQLNIKLQKKLQLNQQKNIMNMLLRP